MSKNSMSASDGGFKISVRLSLDKPFYLVLMLVFGVSFSWADQQPPAVGHFSLLMLYLLQ